MWGFGPCHSLFRRLWPTGHSLLQIVTEDLLHVRPCAGYFPIYYLNESVTFSKLQVPHPCTVSSGSQTTGGEDRPPGAYSLLPPGGIALLLIS